VLAKTKEIKEIFVIGELFQRRGFEIEKKNVMTVQINCGDGFRISRQIIQRVAAAGRNRQNTA
jgi:hypothetical protein